MAVTVAGVRDESRRSPHAYAVRTIRRRTARGRPRFLPALGPRERQGPEWHPPPRHPGRARGGAGATAATPDATAPRPRGRGGQGDAEGRVSRGVGTLPPRPWRVHRGHDR